MPVKRLGAGWRVCRTENGKTIAVPTMNVVLDSRHRAVASMASGRAAMMKMNALEGIVPSEATKARLEEFDRKRLSPAERRAEIVKAYGRKS